MLYHISQLVEYARAHGHHAHALPDGETVCVGIAATVTDADGTRDECFIEYVQDYRQLRDALGY